MILKIILTSHRANLTLQTSANRSVVAVREFFVDNDLSSHILTEIDALLKSASVSLKSIERVEYEAKDAGFTTERIGQAVANALTYHFSPTPPMKEISAE